MQGGWSVGRQPPCIVHPEEGRMDVLMFAGLVFSGLMLLVWVMNEPW